MIIKPRKPKTFGMQESSFLFVFFFKFYFIFKLYIIVLVLPNIKMNPKEVYSNIILPQGTKQNNLK